MSATVAGAASAGPGSSTTKMCGRGVPGPVSRLGLRDLAETTASPSDSMKMPRPGWAPPTRSRGRRSSGAVGSARRRSWQPMTARSERWRRRPMRRGHARVARGNGQPEPGAAGGPPVRYRATLDRPPPRSKRPSRPGGPFLVPGRPAPLSALPAASTPRPIRRGGCRPSHFGLDLALGIRVGVDPLPQAR